MKKTIIVLLIALFIPLFNVNVHASGLNVTFDKYVNYGKTMRFTFTYPAQAGYELVYQQINHHYNANGSYSHAASGGRWYGNRTGQTNFIRKSNNLHVEVIFKYVATGSTFNDSPIYATVHLYPNDTNPRIIYGGGQGGGGGEPQPDGQITGFREHRGNHVTWNEYAGASSYQIWQGNRLYSSPMYDHQIGYYEDYVQGGHVYKVLGLNSSGEVIAQSPELYISPRPYEYPFSLHYREDTNGNINLEWFSSPFAQTYRIYKDGTLIDEVTGNTFPAEPNSFYVVQAVDSGGTVIEEDAVFTETLANMVEYPNEEHFPPGHENEWTGGGGGQPPTDCDFCAFLAMVECPYWDTYMGDITNAVRNAIDWDLAAGKIRDAIVPALTNSLVNNLVPAMTNSIGNEFRNILGEPTYTNGQTGVTVPTRADYQPDYTIPTIQDIPSQLDFDVFDNVDHFEVIDLTPQQEIEIPDAFSFPNLASEPRPQPKESDLGREREMPVQPTEPRKLEPVEHEKEPRQPTEPTEAEGRKLNPIDWNNEGEESD